MATSKADAKNVKNDAATGAKSADKADNSTNPNTDATVTAADGSVVEQGRPADYAVANPVTEKELARVRMTPDVENAKASANLAEDGRKDRREKTAVVGHAEATYPDGVPGQIIRPEELPDPELQKTVGVDPVAWRNNGKLYVEGEPTPQ